MKHATRIKRLKIRVSQITTASASASEKKILSINVIAVVLVALETTPRLAISSIVPELGS